MDMEHMPAVGQPDYEDYQADILKVIQSSAEPAVMREQLSDFHEHDLAQVLPLLSAEERFRFYEVTDAASLARVMEYIEEPAPYLDELVLAKRLDVLAQMEPTSSTDYFNALEQDERASLLEQLPDEAKDELRMVASFGEDEIGSRMSTNYIELRRSMSVREAMRSMIDQAATSDNVSTLYVLDHDGSFYGAIDLKDLIIARKGDSLEALTVTSYPYVYATDLIDECIERLRDYSEDSIPILDAQNRLCGVLTAQEMAELVDDEMSEDYARLAGLTSQEDLREPLMKSIGKRLPWLAILLVLGMLVSVVVGAFERVVAELTVIVSFQSLILGMAGNAGTQSLAITIRVLADEALTAKQRMGLLLKEARVGLCNGFLMGLLSFVFVGCYLNFLKGETPLRAFAISGCTGIALQIAIFLSAISGTLIPMIFKRLRIDPAVASGPLITTVNDLMAVVTYYGLAWLMILHVLY